MRIYNKLIKQVNYKVTYKETDLLYDQSQFLPSYFSANSTEYS